MSFPTKKAQELLNKLGDHILYDGECWLCWYAENAQVLQKPQKVLQRTDVSYSFLFQQPIYILSSLSKYRWESWIYPSFVRIVQKIAKILANLSQDQHYIPGGWIDSHNWKPKTNGLDSNISLIPDICLV